MKPRLILIFFCTSCFTLAFGQWPQQPYGRNSRGNNPYGGQQQQPPQDPRGRQPQSNPYQRPGGGGGQDPYRPSGSQYPGPGQGPGQGPSGSGQAPGQERDRGIGFQSSGGGSQRLPQSDQGGFPARPAYNRQGPPPPVKDSEVAAVGMFLKTEEGQKDLAAAVDKEAGVIAQEMIEVLQEDAAREEETSSSSVRIKDRISKIHFVQCFVLTLFHFI